MRLLLLLCGLIALVFASGCGPNVESDQERLKRLVPNAAQTTKVTGKVTVDGAPVKDILVTLHNPKQSGKAQRPNARTREDGTFQISTYLEGDGAPPGEYHVTLEWLTFQSIGAQWIGPDKLKNQYNDPKSTPFHVTVTDAPLEIPPFELKVEGVASPKADATAGKKAIFKRPSRE